MIRCKLCDDEFDERENPNKCPRCSEEYFIITLTDYQRLVAYIQDKQCRIDQLFQQSWDARISDNKFKNHLRRENDIYRDIDVWFNLIMKEFNIPKANNLHSPIYYHAPLECQLNSRKVCNSCGDC